MNIIIRLQNLAWSANASDIRQFFQGLHIPEGGVHIVGGENGDAFIAFSTDEDARRAMSMTGSKLKGVQVSLMLSSRAEMQKVIEKARMMSMQSTLKTTPEIQSLPSVEAFTNQFERKLPDNSNIISTQQQQLAALTANYKPQQQNALLSTQLLNFQMKPNDLITSLQTNIAPTNLVAGQTALYNNYNQLNSAEYLNYMKMANAAGSIQLDNKQLQLQQQNSYNRNGSLSDSSRDRSRSPLSSRYDSSDDKKEKRRRTRFSSPESNKLAAVAAATPVINSLMQAQPAIQMQQQQAVISTNMLANRNAPKMNNNIWDVPPPMNLNPYTSFNNNNGLLNNIVAAQTRNYQTASDNKSFLPSVQQYQSSQGNGTVPAINNNDVGRCIKVTNVDKDTTYSDIRKFFNGLPIDDIKFLTDNKGNHNGIVLIKFISSDSKKQSMIKNGWQLKSTLIMITSITEEDYENGLDSTKSRGRDDRKDRYNNRYRDRSDSREREYSRERDRGSSPDRFNRNRPQNNNRKFNNNRDYGNSNNPRFNNRREFHRDNNSATRDNGFNRFNKNRQENEQEEKVEYVPDENYRVLVIDDIPEKNEDDLFAAFPNIVSVVIDKYMAYVKFTTHEAAKAVLENRFIHYIRNKRVFIEKGSDMQFADYAKKFGKINNPEMKDHIEEESMNENSNESQEQQPSMSDSNSNDGQTKPISRDPRQRAQQNGNNTNGNSNNMMSNLKTDCVLVKNLEIDCTIEDVENFFSEIQRNNMRTHVLLDKRGKQCGDCFIEFKFEHDMKKALEKNNTMMGKNQVQVMPIPREQVEAVLSSFGDDNNGQFRNQNRPVNRDWAPPSDFGSPGCVVMLSNLCYRATIEDIIDAFCDYDLHPDQIIRRYNDLGQPTGNACINFNSPSDAEKACDSLNKTRILNRPVWLRRCNL